MHVFVLCDFFCEIVGFFCYSRDICGKIANMRRDTLQTIAVIAAVFMAAWHISAMVAANTAAISANTAAIAELRGALLLQSR